MEYVHLETYSNSKYERQEVMRHDNLNQSIKERPQKQSHIINFVPLE